MLCLRIFALILFTLCSNFIFAQSPISTDQLSVGTNAEGKNAQLDLGFGNGTPKWRIETRHTGQYNYNGSLILSSKVGNLWNDPLVEQLVIDRFGNVGIGVSSPSYKLQVNGSFKADGLNMSSDRRLKERISSIANSDQIYRLKGVQYYWKNKDDLGKDLHFGFIAQEVESVFPQLVATDADGIKSVAYIELIPMMVEEMRALQNRIQDLEKSLRREKEHSSSVSLRLERLEQQMEALLSRHMEIQTQSAQK